MSSLVVAEPMNPAAPVTNTRMHTAPRIETRNADRRAKVQMTRSQALRYSPSEARPNEAKYAKLGPTGITMTAIKSAISSSSAAFKTNTDAMRKLVGELKGRLATAALGGDERSRKRHTERGKLLPRDRVERLIDPGSPFLELSPLAAFGMYDGDIHGAGIITGVGRV